jgi:uncharacterized membrane protein YdjX (TVP38/TMEM64 family)
MSQPANRAAPPQEPGADVPGSRQRVRWALWLVVGAVVALLVVSAILGGAAVAHSAARVRAIAQGGEGRAGVPVYALAALFTFLTVLLPLPAEAAALLNGTLFPPLTAFILTWTAAMAGAGASYECGLRLGRGPAARLFGAERLGRIERLIDRAGWPTLLALRLSPVMAFTALNWASGVLALSRPIFYWTVAAGLIPGTYVFTMAPELLLSQASTAKLVGLAASVMVVLFGLSWHRLRSRTSVQGRPAGRPPLRATSNEPPP